MSGQATSNDDHAEVRAASGSNDGSQRHARPEQPDAERPANAGRPPPPPKELRPTQSRPADAGRPQPAAHGRGANFGPPGKRPIHALKAHKEISTGCAANSQSPHGLLTACAAPSPLYSHTCEHDSARRTTGATNACAACRRLSAGRGLGAGHEQCPRRHYSARRDCQRQR